VKVRPCRSSIQRLKGRFEREYETWKKRDLSGLEVVYWWTDGLYVKAGMRTARVRCSRLWARSPQGEKIVLACESGERESKESWLTLLRDLKHRGLTFPRLTVADDYLGIWSALGEIHPTGEK
jgi:transposase-like protein